jgi:membrane-bound metal-dependent hydrolase YbcI (DUF457 family)
MITCRRCQTKIKTTLIQWENLSKGTKFFEMVKVVLGGFFAGSLGGVLISTPVLWLWYSKRPEFFNNPAYPFWVVGVLTAVSCGFFVRYEINRIMQNRL